jgi:DNA-binding LytR/AlgR family response regulator
MTCIIVDDEPNAIEVLKKYTEQVPLLTLKGTFRNPVKALSFLQGQAIDLMFLDINMPHLSGIQVLQSLTDHPMVIFTTAYSTYAVESYDWNAIDYLVKPIAFERFFKAVTKAHEHLGMAPANLESPEPYVLLKSGSQTHRVKWGDILFIAKASNYLEVQTTEKKILIRANMNSIFSWLPQKLFCRIHKSYVVNLKHVSLIETHQIKVNKSTIPLGASYRDDFLKRLETKQ